MQRHRCRPIAPLSKPLGFTLIELLIVIAIIALLISILLPVLQAARNEGTKALCVANLKEIMNANSMYDIDNGDSRIIPWYYTKEKNLQVLPAWGTADFFFAQPDTITPWVFGGFRAPRPEGAFATADSSIYPAQYRPLNKYVDPNAHCDPADENDRGKDIIKLYVCPGDRYHSTNMIGNPALYVEEESHPAHESNGNSYTLNTRWLQGFYGINFTSQIFNPQGQKDAFARIARGTIGGAASRFVQWVELGMYSAAQNSAEKPEWSVAQPQRVGWHRKFSNWSAAFADGHVSHGYFDTRQVYGLGGSIWQPDYYRGLPP
ncbi:MAG: prepilin-type N-terminal cleavage/methylation domain-containing protein [Planctomycetota bacterium]